MKCKNCNNKLKKNLKYCDNCGSEIPVKSEKQKIILTIIACVCCFALIVITLGGYLVYHEISETKKLEQEATKLVEEFLIAYTKQESNLNQYLLTTTSLISSDVNYGEYQSCCAERLDYKIINASKNDSGIITVSVEIENIDFNAVMKKLDETNFSDDDDIVESFYSAIQSSDVPTKTYKCDVKCKKYPTGMKILFDGELSNALLGGYSAYVTGNVEQEDIK